MTATIDLRVAMQEVLRRRQRLPIALRRAIKRDQAAEARRKALAEMAGPDAPDRFAAIGFVPKGFGLWWRRTRAMPDPGRTLVSP